MLSDKSVLLERINTAINKKWYQKSADVFELHVEPELTGDHSYLTNKNYFTQSKNTASLERIEQRIEGLERQNSQLLHFIDFLVENLPDLVINILDTDREKQNILNHQAGKEEGCEGPTEAARCYGKNDPYPTPREKDVLELLVKGFCAKEIANKLFISETTVITHKKNLKEKFNARNTVELISKAQPHLSTKNNQ